MTLRIEGDLTRLPVATDLVAYRVLQEALTNAHKHGAEHRAHVLVEVGPDAARLVVTNPVAARGGATAAAPAEAGHGLLGIRERVASVRGTVEAGPAAGGYRLAVTLPLPADEVDAGIRHLDRRNGRRPMTSVLIVDDQTLIRTALRELLGHEPGITIVGRGRER